MPKFRIYYTLHRHYNDGTIEVEASNKEHAIYKADQTSLEELKANASGSGYDLEIFDVEQGTFSSGKIPFPNGCEFATTREEKEDDEQEEGTR